MGYDVLHEREKVMKASELKAIFAKVPDDAEVFVDFPESVHKKLCEHILSHYGIPEEEYSIDGYSMSIERIDTSWGDNNKVVTIIPDEIIRC